VDPLDLGELALDCLRQVALGLPPGIRLKREVDATAPAVEADATQLRRVVSNLVTNAIESIEGAKGEVIVRVRVVESVAQLEGMRWEGEVPDARAVVLEVEDSGVGIEAGALSRVFDPFYTTKKTGRGLGLASTLGIVRGHGGAIGVRSTPGSGTTFAVALRCSPRPAHVEQPAPAEAAPRKGRGERILVVDDEPLVRQFARAALANAGYEVLVARDGAEAIDTLQHEAGRVAAVLLDLSMPGMSGGAVLARLRRERPSLRVVLMSGYDEERANAELDGVRPDAFLHKPFTPARLLEALGRVVDAG
jgi:CheY-like chemotaxis protein